MRVDSEEWSSLKSEISASGLRSKISTLNEQKGRGRHTKYAPNVKSPRATQTTIAIVGTFAKMRELSRAINLLSDTKQEDKQKTLMQKSGEILSDVLDDALEVSEDETTMELNLAFMKLKRTVKRRKKY